MRITWRIADRSFDLAVSLRVLMHTPDWRQCVAELCRVARRRVIVDFPARRQRRRVAGSSRVALAAAAGAHDRGVSRLHRSADPAASSGSMASA